MGSIIEWADAPSLEVRAERDRKRASVAFRFFLAIPHLFVLLAAGIVASLAGSVGWVTVLVTGRLPQKLHFFLARFLTYATRVNAYVYLLTDTWPHIGLDDPTHPVQIEIAAPDRLNRAAVLFRFWLMIPAYLIAALATAGWYLVMILTWFVIVITLVCLRLSVKQRTG